MESAPPKSTIVLSPIATILARLSN
jgi:hypothetical protein